MASHKIELLSPRPLISATQVQARIIETLKRVEKAAGKPFYMADTYGPTAVCWYLGSVKKLLKALAHTDLFVYIEFHGKKKPVRLRGDTAENFAGAIETENADGEPVPQEIASITVYDQYHLSGQLIHSIRNGVRIILPQRDERAPTPAVFTREFSFVQMRASDSEFENSPTIEVCGQRFKSLPNLHHMLSTAAIPQEVDLVYTWVDSSDPEWISARDKAHDQKAATVDAALSSRFENRNELLFSLRSVLTYFRGFRKIFIVTNGTHPKFIGEGDPRIEFVSHSAIFPNKSDLPTFNSHAIEANLHRIPGLSEKYIYLNDDIFFSRTVTPSMFFDQYGRSLYFMSRSIAIPGGPATDDDPAGDAAAKNARDLIKTRFGVLVSRKFKHAPIAINKSVILQMEKDFPEAFKQTSASRFRGKSNLAISGSLYFHYATCIGKAAEGDLRYDYFDINAPDFLARTKKRLFVDREKERLDTFCVNDYMPSEFTKDNEKVFRFMAPKLFPGAAPFERL